MTLNRNDRQLLGSVIVQLQLLSNGQQYTLECLQREACPDLVGAITSASRAVDLLERHQRELSELLDHPPRLGSDGRARAIPGPAGDLGSSAGLGVVAA